ncbi:AlpA family phage regulatory protein [Rhodohalobacter sp. SW132]|uniref:helix-turn-helix transcriptional regulator n=1 Tax=Rhodohalobacter sp. SW132 TaxID=2293433 RepID=UPI000E23F3C8|nr:AlpA family phage regulatory protein [Rhodohalobacter sp. SW132]REL33753.1 AlpA family phage regulatory protein [Rhodohalobacter sp. SW132]
MNKIIRPKTVALKLGISIPTLYRRMKEPDFPDKIRISKQATGFVESEINEWIESQRESSNMELA